MKKSLFLLLCLLVPFFVFAQQKDTQRLLEEVEVSPPEFTGVHGAYLFKADEHAKFESLSDYINSHVQYPDDALAQFREGKVIVQFTVQPSGDLTNFAIVNSVYPSIDDEVIRVLKTTNNMWRPGYKNKEAVPMEREIGVVFKLSDTRSLQDMATIYYQKGNKLLLNKDNPKRAIRKFDQGIVLLPNEKSLLLSRGLALYELGDKDGACRDWNRIKSLGGIEADAWLNNFCEMSGYAEMMEIVKK